MSDEDRELLRAAGPGAVKKLIELMETSKSPKVQLQAAVAILDRVYGKPTQTVANEDGTPVGGGLIITSDPNIKLPPGHAFIVLPAQEPEEP